MKNLIILLTTLILTLNFAIAQDGMSFQSQKAQGIISKITNLLGDFPNKDSVQDIRDFNVLFYYQDHRTVKDCQRAGSEVTPSIENLFAGINGPLTLEEVKKVSPLLWVPLAELGVYTSLAKNHYKRARPYLRNSKIKPCIKLSSSYAYPSGHAAMGFLIARVLSEVYPQRAHLLQARANEIALDRVIGGVHHPSDIVAGKKLGNYIAQFFINSEVFIESTESINK
jgi:acid phosphatase (class A)